MKEFNIIIVVIGYFILIVFTGRHCYTNYVNYNHKFYQGVGMSALELLHEKQQEYKKINGKYATDFKPFNLDKIYLPYYLYVINNDSFYPQNLSPGFDLPPFLSKDFSGDSYIMYAIRNTDADPCLDIFAIIETGDVYHVSNDSKCSDPYKQNRSAAAKKNGREVLGKIRTYSSPTCPVNNPLSSPPALSRFPDNTSPSPTGRRRTG